MNSRPSPLPQAAKLTADRGELVAAIQITQDVMGVTLQEAQQAVHAYIRGASKDYAQTTDHRIPPHALASLQRGNVIEAIKHTREATGLGLKEAKDAVERYVAENPHLAPRRDTTLRSGNANLAPIVATLVIGIVIVLVGYWFAAGNAP